MGNISFTAKTVYKKNLVKKSSLKLKNERNIELLRMERRKGLLKLS